MCREHCREYGYCHVAVCLYMLSFVDWFIHSIWAEYFDGNILVIIAGRHAFIGMGFTDRGDSFDFNVALQDHFKYVDMQIVLSCVEFFSNNFFFCHWKFLSTCWSQFELEKVGNSWARNIKKLLTSQRPLMALLCSLSQHDHYCIFNQTTPAYHTKIENYTISNG